MAVKSFNTRIKLKYDQSSNWKPATGNGLVLLQGEFGYDSTKKNFFIGDGITSSKALKYVIGESIIADYIANPSATLTDPVANTDSLNIALAKLQSQVDRALAAGVQSIDGKTGAITLGNGIQTDDNNVLSAKVVPGNGLSLDSDGIKMAAVVASTSGEGGSNGAMTAAQAEKLAGIETGAQVNVLEGIQVNGTDLSITNKKVNVTVSEGSTNGTIKVNGTDISVHGLGTAAYTDSTDYATSAQGDKADSALQLISKGTDGTYVTTTIGNKTNNVQTVGVAVTVQAVSNANSTNQGLAEASDVKNYVDTAINTALDSEVTFQGVTATLPSNPKNGDMWKTSAAVTVPGGSAGEGSSITTKTGDTIIYKNIDGASDNGWYVIPSADDIDDTWRDINVNGSSFLGSGIDTGALNLSQAQNNPVTISGTNGTIKIEHVLVDDPQDSSPWGVAGAYKFKTDPWGHVRTAGAITSADITRTAGTITATTVEGALTELEGKITSANITIDGHRGAITTGNGLTDVESDGGSFAVQIDSTNANGLSVGSNGVAMAQATGSSFGTVKVTVGNGLTLNNGVVAYAHNTTAVTIASKSGNAITINGTFTPDASDVITMSNAITLADVAATGAAADVSYDNTTSELTATTVQGAIDEVAGTAAGAVQDVVTLKTSASGQSRTPSGESLEVSTDHTEVVLHDIAKTGNTDDLLQTLTILLDCGTATSITDTASNS